MTIQKFHGQFENFMDNSENFVDNSKFHGQFENFMDNVVHEMTTPSIGGQLSVDNRCPWTIVHETYKTQRSQLFRLDKLVS
jgi:hypothetical protein